MFRQTRLNAVAVAFASLAFAGQAGACDIMRTATISLDEARDVVRGEVAASAAIARPYRYGDYWVVAVEHREVETKLYVHRDTGELMSEAEAMAAHDAKVAAVKAAARDASA